MGQLVREGVFVAAPVPDDDVPAGRVGPRTDLGGRPLGGRSGVQPHIGEVRPEPPLHLRAHRPLQRPPGPPQHVVHPGPLDGVRVLFPPPAPRHPGHHRVADAPLQLTGLLRGQHLRHGPAHPRLPGPAVTSARPLAAVPPAIVRPRPHWPSRSPTTALPLLPTPPPPAAPIPESAPPGPDPCPTRVAPRCYGRAP